MKSSQIVLLFSALLDVIIYPENVPSSEKLAGDDQVSSILLASVFAVTLFTLPVGNTLLYN